MIDIPTWVVALSALTTAIALITTSECARVPIRVFSLSSFMQFLIYAFFYISDTPTETRQFMARVSVIAMNFALLIIISAARVRHGN